MILTTVKNQVKFKYVLMDTWFGAKENFEFITKHKKEFISAIKSNKLIALSLEDKKLSYLFKANQMAYQKLLLLKDA